MGEPRKRIFERAAFELSPLQDHPGAEEEVGRDNRRIEERILGMNQVRTELLYRELGEEAIEREGGARVICMERAREGNIKGADQKEHRIMHRGCGILIIEGAILEVS